ncbi:MAG: hypothetical protein ACF8PG_08885, partial [Maioricimonas sp. JB045]
RLAMSCSSAIGEMPIALKIAATSLLASTLTSWAFSTLRILPRSGRIACVAESRPVSADPPA